MVSANKLPNFIIFGVQKAGTSSVYNYLKQHPQVYMSPIKETNFLERDWSKLPPAGQNCNGINTWEKYCDLFTGVQDEIAIGEVSPNYLFHHQSSVGLIKKYLPNAKLIAILRNPVERAYSDYLMNLRDAIGNSHRSLEEQLKYSANKSFVLLKGLYYTHLQHFYEQFPSQQIKVCLYDDLSQDPVTFMQDMYNFLQVERSFIPNTSTIYQKAKIPRSQAFNRLLRQQNPLRSLARSVLKMFMPLETRQKIHSALINLNYRDKSAMPLTPELRQQLIDYYREDILKLQDLLGRDLSSWLKDS
jgi:hypothetical protein